MILQDMDLKKALIIKTDLGYETEHIANHIHKQIKRNDDYIDDRIILKYDIEHNEIRLFVFSDSNTVPHIHLDSRIGDSIINIEISTTTKEDELSLLSSIKNQLLNNDDYDNNSIIVTNSIDRNDLDVNGHCVRVIFHEYRKNKVNLIV